MSTAATAPAVGIRVVDAVVVTHAKPFVVDLVEDDEGTAVRNTENVQNAENAPAPSGVPMPSTFCTSSSFSASSVAASSTMGSRVVRMQALLNDIRRHLDALGDSFRSAACKQVSRIATTSSHVGLLRALLPDVRAVAQCCMRGAGVDTRALKACFQCQGKRARDRDVRVRKAATFRAWAAFSRELKEALREAAAP